MLVNLFQLGVYDSKALPEKFESLILKVVNDSFEFLLPLSYGLELFESFTVMCIFVSKLIDDF